MAGSRVYKIGTVFSRITGLIKAGAKQWEERPVWYDVYQAFPPKMEPDFSRPEPTEEIRTLFYSEDVLRAKFYREFGSVGLINLSERNASPTICQLFIEEYTKLKENTKLSEDNLWKEVITILESRGIRLTHTEPVAQDVNTTFSSHSLSELFSEARKEEPQLNAKAQEIDEDELLAEEEKMSKSDVKVEIDLNNIFSEDDNKEK